MIQCSFLMSSDVSTSMALTEALLTLTMGVWGQEKRCDQQLMGMRRESESPMADEEPDSRTWGDLCIIPCRYAETLAFKVGELGYVEEMGLARESVNTGDRGAMLGVSHDLAVWRSLRTLWLDLISEQGSAFCWWIKVKGWIGRLNSRLTGGPRGGSSRTLVSFLELICYPQVPKCSHSRMLPI